MNTPAQILVESHTLLPGHFSSSNLELVDAWWKGLTHTQQLYCLNSLENTQISVPKEFFAPYTPQPMPRKLILKVLAHSLFPTLRASSSFPATEVKLGEFK